MPSRSILRTAGICGMVAPFLALAFIMGAMYLAPWWSITDMSLSRLAGSRGDTPIWTASGAPAILLNSGLVLTGALMMFFAYGLRSSSFYPGRGGRIGKDLFVAGGLLMSMIGIFPLPTGAAHDLVSYSFFVVWPTALLLMGVSLLIDRRSRSRGVSLILLAVLGLLPFTFAWAFEGLAIPELMALVPLTVFSVLTGARLLRKDGLGP